MVIGGDYGFKITPMGQNARDIGHFVEEFLGFTPTEIAPVRRPVERRWIGWVIKVSLGVAEGRHSRRILTGQGLGNPLG